MRAHARNSYGIALIVRRALERRMGPLNFLLLLGFFSSLVLLYISLHVYFFSISQDISENRERLELLIDRNVTLTASYNDLISPERIVPMAEKIGMRPGSPEEMRRFALYEYIRKPKKEASRLAQADASGRLVDKDGLTPEKR